MEARAQNPRIRAIALSRNFGKECALTAGLDFATGRAVVPMDADLQDPPELIPEMLRLWRDGHDVVLAHRAARPEDGALKRATAGWFYRVIGRLSQTRIPPDVGDFRLMDARVVAALALLPERSRFMKGVFAWLGFRTATVEYQRPARARRDQAELAAPLGPRARRHRLVHGGAAEDLELCRLHGGVRRRRRPSEDPRVRGRDSRAFQRFAPPTYFWQTRFPGWTNRHRRNTCLSPPARRKNSACFQPTRSAVPHVPGPSWPAP